MIQHYMARTVYLCHNDKVFAILRLLRNCITYIYVKVSTICFISSVYRDRFVDFIQNNRINLLG
jgi:hypothetical protein